MQGSRLIVPGRPGLVGVTNGGLITPRTGGLVTPAGLHATKCSHLHAHGAHSHGAETSSRQHFIPPHVQDKLDDSRSRSQQDSDRYRNQRGRLNVTEAIRSLRGDDALEICVEHVKVFDSKGQPDFDLAELMRESGQPPVGDHQIDLAMQHAENIFEFVKHLSRIRAIPEEFCLMSKPFEIYVRYDDDPDDENAFFNAFYDPVNNRFVFGHVAPESPDAKYFIPLVEGYDVFGHETGHGLIDQVQPLRYLGVPGLLNESVADSIGIAAAHYLSDLGAPTGRSHFDVGADILVGDYSLRNMLQPGTAYNRHEKLGDDPQPDHWAEILNLSDGVRGNLAKALMIVFDNLGVHVLSGLANKPFAEAAMLMGAKTYMEPITVRLRTLAQIGKDNPGLVEWAKLEVKIAEKMYGNLGRYAFQKGWSTTGVLKDPDRRWQLPHQTLEGLGRLNPVGGLVFYIENFVEFLGQKGGK